VALSQLEPLVVMPRPLGHWAEGRTHRRCCRNSVLLILCLPFASSRCSGGEQAFSSFKSEVSLILAGRDIRPARWETSVVLGSRNFQVIFWGDWEPDTVMLAAGPTVVVLWSIAEEKCPGTRAGK
jgi:hypothetical protein